MICGRCAVGLKSACTAAPAGRGDGRAATAFSCGAESPSPVFVVALVAGSRLSRGGGSDGVIFPLSVVQSLRLCKKRRICRRIHRHGGYYHYYDYVIAPGSGRGGPGHSSPLQVVSVQAALFPSCSRDIPLSRAALNLNRGLYRGIIG